MSISSQLNEWSCIYLLGVSILPLSSDFSIGFWNSSILITSRTVQHITIWLEEKTHQWRKMSMWVNSTEMTTRLDNTTSGRLARFIIPWYQQMLAGCWCKCSKAQCCILTSLSHTHITRGPYCLMSRVAHLSSDKPTTWPVCHWLYCLTELSFLYCSLTLYDYMRN
jgi:hypothetical protein